MKENDLKNRIKASKETKNNNLKDNRKKTKETDNNNFGEQSYFSDNNELATKSNNKKETNIIICLIVFILLACLSVAIIYPIRLNNDSVNNKIFSNSYKNVTEVGYLSEDLGTIKRNIPTEAKNEGMSSAGYPQFGYTLNMTTEQKNEIIAESIYLTANGTWRDVSARTTGSYDKMDKDGYLYLNNGTPVNDAQGNHRKLYKHTVASSMYFGEVSNAEPAVIKKLTMRKRGYNGYAVTGLYAPAGEVIKIEISEADMKATGGLTFHIGQALYNGQANNIWSQRNVNRMPIILNTMTLTANNTTLENGVYTGYVGSYVGGPIYIRNNNAEVYSVTISGGVNYSHFILGYTTKEEFEKNAKSTAPYFDLEVWDFGVLHSGPKYYAKNFSYDQIYDAAILWEKISLVSTRVRKQGVVFLYDPFVAAGAAVAFPGRRSVNCPAGWMASSLNYESLVTSGSWGNLHEYHHNFQGFGVGSTGEVTNNSLNIVAYSLFTKISSSRQISGFGGAGLSGWNCYTSGTWTLNQVNNNAIGGTNGLAVYATLIHNLGQDAFIKSAVTSGTNYWNKWQENTHQDMSYYANLVSSYGGAHTLATNDYPMFVPVSSVYQTGRSYTYDNEKRYIKTMQPFVIPYGLESYTVDLNPYTVNASNQYESGSVVIGNGFKYSIKSVKTEEGFNGTFEKTGDNIYTFKPNSQINSGKVYVTLEITTNNGDHTYNGKELQDVDLVLEFQQSHESKKAILERTTYTYSADNAYTSATEAFENNYAGYVTKVEEDNTNLTQNSNTDRWYTSASGLNGKFDIAPDNSVLEIKGKLYIPETGKYRIYLRGRVNCALYISTDGGKNYECKATITSWPRNNSWDFRYDEENSYFDLECKSEDWVYFKEVLIVNNSPTISFVGMGMTQWTIPSYTMETKYYDSNGNPVAVDSNGKPIDENAVIDDSKTQTIYKNAAGQIVSAEEANNTDPIMPTSANYVTAYREDYEFTKQFESDYFYTRDYAYNYLEQTNYDVPNQRLVETNYQPWTQGVAQGHFDISNFFNDDATKNIHSVQNKFISETNPFNITVDLGQTIKANHVTFYGYTSGSVGNIGMVKDFVLYGSLNGQDYFVLYEYTGFVSSYRNVTLKFDEATFRYYKLVVTKTDNGRYFAMNRIGFNYEFSLPNGTKISSDNNIFTYKGNWELKTAISSFGHIYYGKNGASVEFEFEGNRLGVLSNKSLGDKFEVYIDDKKVDSINLKSDDYLSASFISPELTNGKHKVRIKCTGNASIDSIVYWKAPKE